MRFYVPSSEDSVFASGSYELPIQEEIASLLRPGSIFYDVGANYGFFTLLAARIIGSVGAVISFEPTADNVRTIQAKPVIIAITESWYFLKFGSLNK